jgi:hypothetical protein
MSEQKRVERDFLPPAAAALRTTWPSGHSLSASNAAIHLRRAERPKGVRADVRCNGLFGAHSPEQWSDCESRRGWRWTEETDDCSKSSVGAQLGEIHPFISDGTVYEQ